MFTSSKKRAASGIERSSSITSTRATGNLRVVPTVTPEPNPITATSRSVGPSGWNMRGYTATLIWVGMSSPLLASTLPLFFRA